MVAPTLERATCGRHNQGPVATRSPTLERHDVDTATIERERDLKEIDMLMAEYKSRLEAVSEEIISHATKKQTLSMYEELRKEAEHDDLRAQRVAYMKENEGFLNDMIAKAAYQSAQFGGEIENAKQWLGSGPAEELRSWFYSPNSLEMYRSMWFQNEWQTMKAHGKKLLHDRDTALSACKAAGLTHKDVPMLATVENVERFANLPTELEKRGALAALEAAVVSAGNGKLDSMRKMETLLTPYTKGKNYCLHPGKLGLWLKKIALDPAAYTEPVIRGYVADWQALRDGRDTLQRDYRTAGRPDGCAPLEVNAFLELPVASRRVVLTEGRNRLDAAVRIRKEETNAFEQEKTAVRQSVDLEDFDVAERALAALRKDHPYDADLASITAHIAILRERKQKEEATEEEQGNAVLAEDELETMLAGVPSVLQQHYRYMFTDGSDDERRTFMTAMLRRKQRRANGETNDEMEMSANHAADEADETDVVTVRTTADHDNAELIMTQGTPPAHTLALLKAHGDARPDRSPALVVAGLSDEQNAQMVSANVRMLNLYETATNGPNARKIEEEQVLAA